MNPSWQDRLRALLEEIEEFPFVYTHKFVGKNTPAFAEAVDGLRVAFPKLEERGRRESGAGNHVAYTFGLAANSADEIIALLAATAALADLQVLL